MAIRRPIPTCSYCGKPIAKAIFKKTSKLFFGDRFERWEYKDCKCKGAEEARKKLKDSGLDQAIQKIIEKGKEKQN